MANPFKRSAAEHRPTLRPAPGMQPFELDSDGGFQPSDFDEDGDWEDSVQDFEAGAADADRFAG
jgi:hypothetical protein